MDFTVELHCEQSFLGGLERYEIECKLSGGKEKWLSWYSNNRLLMYIVEGLIFCRFHNLLVSKQTL